MSPGKMAQARMPLCRSSALIDWVRPVTPNFDATYAAPALALAISPASETMLTIVPSPCRRMTGSTAWTKWKVPLRLTSISV